jgi:hypothetical protein
MQFYLKHDFFQVFSFHSNLNIVSNRRSTHRFVSFEVEDYSSVNHQLRQVHDEPRLFMIGCVVCCAFGVPCSYLESL